jgi:CheY-like chemotaxis protein
VIRNANSERLVLRAELSRDDRQIIAHTTALAADCVFVRTDEPLDIGDSVALELSFRRLLSPVHLDAQVVAKDLGAGLGYWPGVTLAFTASTEQEVLLQHLLVTRTAPKLAPYRILVVEDSVLTRDVVQLNADRCSNVGAVQLVVESTDSAEAALAMMAEHPFDLALVDLYLPGELDGADLVRRVRERDHDIALIGFSIGRSAARHQFLAAGADLFLDKPVTVKDLFATIERLMLMNVEVP